MTDSSENTTDDVVSSEKAYNENMARELSDEKKSDNEEICANREDEKLSDDFGQKTPLEGSISPLKNKDNSKNNEKDPSVANQDEKKVEKEKQEIENKENDENSNSQTNDSAEDVSQYTTYTKSYEALCVDPKTNYLYRWSSTINNWECLACSDTEYPYETEYCRWSKEKKQWINKVEQSTATEEVKETEFYKWDEESKQWKLKNQPSSVRRAEDGTFTYTDPDGTVFFWDAEKKAWFPKIDDEFMAMYQLNYGFIDNTSLGENKETKSNHGATTPSTNPAKESSSSKAENIELSGKIESSDSAAGDGGGGGGKGLKRKLPEPPKWFDITPEQNTKVYVSNLPDDITEKEFVEVMSKCGLIMKDPNTQKYKVKLYAEPSGQLKGDGLCDYIKVESVELALNLLDGYDVRGNKISVQRAKFQMRGEYNPALKPKKKKKDKEKMQKLKEKLFDWRPEKMRGERSKHERNVIIKNLFEPELFDKEVQLIIEYQNDLREECSKYGTVRKVVIFDRHPDGVAQITMSSPEEADLVVQMMNRRFFSQRRLLAEIWDGKTKYKIDETDAEINQRLSNWDKYLEDDNENKKDGAANPKNENKSDKTVSDENILTEKEDVDNN